MTSLTSQLKELSSGLDQLKAECLEKMKINEPLLGSDGRPVDKGAVDDITGLAKQLIEREFTELRSDCNIMVRISETYDTLGEIGKPATKLFNFLLKTTEESIRNLIEMRYICSIISPNQEDRHKFLSRRAAILREKTRLIKSYIRYQDTIALKLQNKITLLKAERASLRKEYESLHPSSGSDSLPQNPEA